jgi:TPR repeat protein
MRAKKKHFAFSKRPPTRKPQLIFLFGFCYESGKGTPKEIYAAIEYYEIVTNLGLPFAYNCFGRIYFCSDVVAQIISEGLRYWQCGAALNNKESLFEYGNCLYYVDGIPQNGTE